MNETAADGSRSGPSGTDCFGRIIVPASSIRIKWPGLQFDGIESAIERDGHGGLSGLQGKNGHGEAGGNPELIEMERNQ
ncbi:MAG: hypothetical protein ACU841_11680 [Gammaproteobacteria bacterium]